MSFTLAADNPVDHVVDHPFIVSDGGWWLWTAQMGNLVLAGIITIAVGKWLAATVGTGPEEEGPDRYVTKNHLAGTIEVIALYLREQVVRPLLGVRTERFMPFLWTLFFFILVNNLLGLIPVLDIVAIFAPDLVQQEHRAPIGGTPTQNIYVNAILAAFAFVVINAAGIRELGVKGYFAHLTGGAPPAIWPLMVPIEILGMFIKPIALTIRLFANMTAGHILLATLFLFVGMAVRSANPVLTPSVSLVSAVGAFAIYFLELFVAFLQAFIFMFLTAVFISQLEHHHDHDDHDEEHAATRVAEGGELPAPVAA